MRTFTRWNEVSTSDETNDLLLEIALSHARSIGQTELRERITASLTSDRIPDLCDFDLDYSSLSVHDAIQVRQCLAFFAKRSDIEIPGVSKRAVAERKFIECETLCRESNRRFQLRARGEFFFSPRVEAVFHRAQRKIALMLGDVPLLSDLKVRFGPGATTQVPRKKASPRRKLSKPFACSEDMSPYVCKYIEELGNWLEFQAVSPTTVPVDIYHGKLVFVPKNAKTDRPVIIEPMLNSMFQLGVCSHLMDRFKRFGLDLTDQTLNQRLAREGSLTGDLATLDLSSASDTICRELVHDLLPFDWVLFLSELRTSSFVYEGRVYDQEKFSSMGNGFTFPLESLIFFCLAASCCEAGEACNAYGDDIIVPVSRYDLLSEVLACAGFLVNHDKSFSTGPFRESCGHDYLSGINIRPCYIKGPLACFDIFRLHNFYVRAQDNERASILLAYIEPNLRRFGPDGYGDGHLLGAHHLRPHGRNYGWSGYTFETYTFASPKELATLPGDRVYPSYSIYASDPPGWDVFPAIRPDGGIFAKMPKHIRDLSHRYLGRDLVTSLPGKVSYNLIKIYVLS